MLTGSHLRPDDGCRSGRAPRWALLPSLVGVALGLSLGSLVWPGSSLAQEKRPAAAKLAAEDKPILPAESSAQPAEPAPVPGEVGPTEYLIRDKDGKLQHVLNFTFEDFIRLYKLEHHLDNQDQKPRYVIQNVQLTGVAVGHGNNAAAGGNNIETPHAELQAEFTIDVREAGWVRVPLRMPGAILREEAGYQGPGEHLLNFEDQQEGYVSWIRSEPVKTHKVTLKLLAPLVAVGGETQLKLSLPRAPLSQLKLEADADQAQARASEGSEVLKPEPLVGGKTLLTVLRIGGDFELAWHASEGPVATVPTVLEATGALLARIDGRSVNTEARLTVRSFGGQFDRFRLRLPPSAELVGSNQPGVQLVPVEEQDAGGKLIEVKLGRKTAGPVELRLVTERPHNLAQGDELLELSGFEVVGAVRQWGNVAVQVVGDWQVAWGPRRNVRQVDELPESLRRDELTAGFEYYVQPFSLTARVMPQKTRTSVEPEYVVLVGAHQAQLQARFKYTVRGAKLRALEIELPGWEVDEIGPTGLFNPDASLAGEAALWVLPFSQPAAGQFEVTLRAHREVEPGIKILSFDLPRPHADTNSQGLLAVLPADNVELTPDAETTFGLTSQTLKPAIKLPERQQDPLFYRTEAAAARYMTGLAVHSQSISVDALGMLSIDEENVGVEERFVFQVAYEPVDSLNINVPRTLSLDALTVTLDGQRLATTGSRSDPGAEAAELTPVRLALPGPRIGRCELKVNYTVPHDKLSPVTTLSLATPLVTPGTGKLVHNQMHVSWQAGLGVTARKGPWTQANSPTTQSGLTLAARTAPTEIALAVELKQRPTEGKTSIECGWIQTVLSSRGRQDRAVYRFKSGEQKLRIVLPAGAEVSSLDARLDGHPVPLGETEVAGELLVPVARFSQGEHVLDLRYYSLDRGGSGRLVARPPVFRPDMWVRRLYWELVLPGNEHLMLEPGQFTSESTWVRSGPIWHRQPALDQAELETLVGGGAGLPSGANTNHYLFSTVGLVAPLDVWIAPRAVLVFTASLVVLGLGLLLIYFPATRHPALLLVLAVLVLAVSLTRPDSALLLAQAGSLGLLLALLAAALARRTLRRKIMTEPVRGSSRAMLDRSATAAFHRAANSQQSSTATAPVALQVSAPEGEP